ncbi:MAG: hypothetical protein RXR41_04320 [Candidatus Marsarchaeota archaeon]
MQTNNRDLIQAGENGRSGDLVGAGVSEETAVRAGLGKSILRWLESGLEGITERDRILLFIAVFEFLFIITLFGAGQPMSGEQAQAMASSVGSGLPYSRGPEAVALSIFGNNYYLALLMDIPIAGPVLAAYIAFNSGVYVSAQAIAGSLAGAPASGVQMLEMYLSLPTFWLEFMAYSLATLESLYLIFAAYNRRFLSELPKFVVVLVSVTVILLVSAEIEAFFYARHPPTRGHRCNSAAARPSAFFKQGP